jgi:hypothetical protein
VSPLVDFGGRFFDPAIIRGVTEGGTAGGSVLYFADGSQVCVKSPVRDVVETCHRAYVQSPPVQSLIDATLWVLRVGLADVDEAPDIETKIERALRDLGVVVP